MKSLNVGWISYTTAWMQEVEQRMEQLPSASTKSHP